MADVDLSKTEELTKEEHDQVVALINAMIVKNKRSYQLFKDTNIVDETVEAIDQFSEKIGEVLLMAQMLQPSTAKMLNRLGINNTDEALSDKESATKLIDKVKELHKFLGEMIESLED